ncbi:hypothetical protein VTO42DRAFT_4896 [Malbranchea cinnamomea]
MLLTTMGDLSSAQEQLLLVLPFPEPRPLIDALRRDFAHLSVVFYQLDEDETKKIQKESPHIPRDVLAATTILCTINFFPHLRDVPRLKYVHVLTAGIDRIVHDPIVSSPSSSSIAITTVSGIHGPPIAEWVVMNWLIASRRYDDTAQWQREHRWRGGVAPDQLMRRMFDHVGKRVGILGYGSIGRQVARVAVAMGMTVHAYTLSPRPTPASRRDTGYVVPGTGDPDGTLPTSWHHGRSRADLHAFLAQGLDYLLVSLPLTPQTTRLLGADEFAILAPSQARARSDDDSSSRTRRGPFITNVSRGQILDQDALIASLRAGELAGAALDVTDPEPLPPEHPLWDAPNVHIAPHVSAFGEEYLARALDVLRENLARMDKGEDLVNAYQRGRGY